jgi:multidrug efflux pump subunit AcrA (membrane-fusion protein)
VDIVIDTHEEALVVPRSALVAEGRRWNLFRLAEEGETVQALEVRLGYEEGDRVEILEVLEGAGPLAPGDRVVVLGASALSDGARVEVHEEGGTDRVSS